MKIIAVGKKHEDWAREGIERYEKRLKRPFTIEWVLLPHSAREGLESRADESERILSGLKDKQFIVLLDERGRELSSPALADLLDHEFATGKDIVFVIGGAYGVNDAVRDRANLVWSLSPLVFPHQLVRLILVEQLYRAQEIIGGHPYHHA